MSASEALFVKLKKKNNKLIINDLCIVCTTHNTYQRVLERIIVIISRTMITIIKDTIIPAMLAKFRLTAIRKRVLFQQVSGTHAYCMLYYGKEREKCILKCLSIEVAEQP